MNNVWTGNLVRLRAVEPEDWEAFHAFDQDTDGQRSGWQIHLPRSQEGTRAWARELSTKQPDGDNVFLVIESLEGELAGSMNIHGADRRNRTLEYGISVGEQYRGRSFASEAIRIVLRHYFHELGYQKANATVYAFNDASLALHRKLGFVEEGRIRRNHFAAGEYHDEIWFGMTAEEFAARFGLA